MTIFASGALLQALLLAAAGVGQPTSEQAGAALSAGRLDEAAAGAESCLPDPGCALVRGRALFALGRLADAAQALQGARTGNLAAHAAKLHGEAFVLAGRPADALEPLLADALLGTGEFAQAAEQARKAAQLPAQPGDVRAGLDLIRAEAFSGRVDAGEEEVAREGARQWREFWLEHPEHPAAQTARAEEARLSEVSGRPLPEPSGRELLLRAQRLLSAGKPGAAVEAAEAQLTLARALAADGRRGEAGPALTSAWKDGPPRVAAPAGMLFARDRARRGNDPEAVRILDQLARRYPQSGEAEEAAYVAARLQLDQGNEADARRRLARIARRRTGAHASDARWTVAWLSYRRGLPDAAERFAEFTASA